MSNENSRVKDWAAFYRQSPTKYQMNALIAVLRTDGDRMLMKVLRELGLESSLDLVKDADKKS